MYKEEHWSKRSHNGLTVARAYPPGWLLPESVDELLNKQTLPTPIIYPLPPGGHSRHHCLISNKKQSVYKGYPLSTNTYKY